MPDSFIHITDLHFWEIAFNPLRLLSKRALGNINVIMKRRHQFVMDRAWAYLEYINALDIKDVVITGDFASTSTRFEFEEGVRFVQALEDAGKSITLIPGNHDVYTFETVRKKKFEKFFSRWLPNDRLPCTRSLPGGTPIVYVPTVCANLLSSKGRISDSEIEATVLSVEALESPIIVAGHYPILNKTGAYAASPGRTLRNGDKLRTALGDTGKEILYICGHMHRFSDEIDPVCPNIRQLTSGALFRTAPETDSDGDFSVVRIDGSKVGVTRHLHKDGEWSTSE
jgi:hypothetical protein